MPHAGLYGTGFNSYMGGMAGMGSAGFMAGMAGMGMHSPMAAMGGMPGSSMGGIGGMPGAGQAFQYQASSLARGPRFKCIKQRPPVIKTISAKTMVWNQLDPSDVFLWLQMSAPYIWNSINIPGTETEMWAHVAVAWDAYSDSPITFRGPVDAFGKELATYYVHRGQPLMNKTHAAITAEGLELIAKHQEQVKIMMDEHARQLGYAVGPSKALPAPLQPAALPAGHKDSPLEQAKQKAAEKAAAMGLHTPSPSPSPLHAPVTPGPQDKRVTATPSPLDLAKARAAARAAETARAADTEVEPPRKRLNFNQFGMTTPPSRTSD